ncbi:endolytic transglycosylase MltG [Halovulum dunhuangense]|uniref:Endolytic murein transglycosylase n=1 Tax=Halovulum dunhuangense TaxID=1505036 RepID=A0A849L5X7_9RHOB|nr:endolytic transglycosylase MltG [Halovulum dunhuangense]NNU81898.1 endolytic transglycosylase MltG [Halovulum dunhuangense]
MARHIAANALTFLILGLVVVLGLLKWGNDTFNGPGPLAEAAVVEVPRGANLARVTQALTEAGAIRNETVFRIGARYTGQDDELKFGLYRIPAGASMVEILDQLTSGTAAAARFEATFTINNGGVGLRLRDLLAEAPQEQPETLEDALERVTALEEDGQSVAFRVSVSEGLTVFQVIEGLRAIPVMEGEITEVPSEGMLAPDTYAFNEGADRAALVAQMRAAQEARIAAAWEGRDAGLPIDTPEELLVLASIIEKETGVPQERGTVAAVFVNRLNRGMRLQTDPTIIYGITRGQSVFDRPIRRSDIDGVTESREHGAVEYNTYQVDGLPPGPIANPGRASLEAAASPEASNFIYFVADGTGGHAFAETLEEHNRNVANYRRLQNGQ